MIVCYSVGSYCCWNAEVFGVDCGMGRIMIACLDGGSLRV